MTTDMLRLAGEEYQAETFAGGEASCRPANSSDARALNLRSLDLQSLVMRAVVPRLAETLLVQPCVIALPLHLGTRSSARRSAAVDPDPSGEERERLLGELVDSLLRDDLAGVCRSIDATRACGRSLDRIYRDLLAPAAAAVQRLAAADGCSAAAATLAFCNLQLVLRRYAADFHAERPGSKHREHGSRALLVPARAATGAALFGLLLAADVLRREGWEAWTERSLWSPSLVEAVRSQWFDFIGIVACDEPDGTAPDERALAAGVAAIRREGANPHATVIACGPSFVGDAGLADRIGADGGASDPLSALSHVASIVHQGLEQRRLA